MVCGMVVVVVLSIHFYARSRGRKSKQETIVILFFFRVSFLAHMQLCHDFENHVQRGTAFFIILFLFFFLVSHNQPLFLK